MSENEDVDVVEGWNGRKPPTGRSFPCSFNARVLANGRRVRNISFSNEELSVARHFRDILLVSAWKDVPEDSRYDYAKVLPINGLTVSEAEREFPGATIYHQDRGCSLNLNDFAEKFFAARNVPDEDVALLQAEMRTNLVGAKEKKGKKKKGKKTEETEGESTVSKTRALPFLLGGNTLNSWNPLFLNGDFGYKKADISKMLEKKDFISLCVKYGVFRIPGYGEGVVSKSMLEAIRINFGQWHTSQLTRTDEIKEMKSYEHQVSFGKIVKKVAIDQEKLEALAGLADVEGMRFTEKNIKDRLKTLYSKLFGVQIEYDEDTDVYSISPDMKAVSPTLSEQLSSLEPGYVFAPTDRSRYCGYPTEFLQVLFNNRTIWETPWMCDLIVVNYLFKQPFYSLHRQHIPLHYGKTFVPKGRKFGNNFIRCELYTPGPKDGVRKDGILWLIFKNEVFGVPYTKVRRWNDKKGTLGDPESAIVTERSGQFRDLKLLPFYAKGKVDKGIVVAIYRKTKYGPRYVSAWKEPVLCYGKRYGGVVLSVPCSKEICVDAFPNTSGKTDDEIASLVNPTLEKHEAYDADSHFGNMSYYFASINVDQIAKRQSEMANKKALVVAYDYGFRYSGFAHTVVEWDAQGYPLPYEEPIYVPFNMTKQEESMYGILNEAEQDAASLRFVRYILNKRDSPETLKKLDGSEGTWVCEQEGHSASLLHGIRDDAKKLLAVIDDVNAINKDYKNVFAVIRKSNIGGLMPSLSGDTRTYEEVLIEHPNCLKMWWNHCRLSRKIVAEHDRNAVVNRLLLDSERDKIKDYNRSPRSRLVWFDAIRIWGKTNTAFGFSHKMYEGIKNSATRGKDDAIRDFAFQTTQQILTLRLSMGLDHVVFAVERFAQKRGYNSDRMTNREIANRSWDRVTAQLERACNSRRIVFVKVDEAYSSVVDPITGKFCYRSIDKGQRKPVTEDLKEMDSEKVACWNLINRTVCHSVNIPYMTIKPLGVDNKGVVYTADLSEDLPDEVEKTMTEGRGKNSGKKTTTMSQTKKVILARDFPGGYIRYDGEKFVGSNKPKNLTPPKSTATIAILKNGDVWIPDMNDANFRAWCEGKKNAKPRDEVFGDGYKEWCEEIAKKLKNRKMGCV